MSRVIYNLYAMLSTQESYVVEFQFSNTIFLLQNIASHFFLFNFFQKKTKNQDDVLPLAFLVFWDIIPTLVVLLFFRHISFFFKKIPEKNNSLLHFIPSL